MPNDVLGRVHKQLERFPEDGIDAAKSLFWTELNYERVDSSISVRGWPDRAKRVLAEPPRIFAGHSDFYVLYSKLAEGQTGISSSLSLTAERLVITQLLKNHPFALFLFSDLDAKDWHFVNVRYDEDEHRRRVFRRISIGLSERIRTAAERIAMIDLASIADDIDSLSPLAIQNRHDEAFNVEAVTRQFFKRFAELFYLVRDEIAQVTDLASDADDLAQTFLDRMVFLYFIQKKGWLDGNPNYLIHNFNDGHRSNPEETSFYGSMIYPLFLALSTPAEEQKLSEILGTVPFLNGGLFDLRIASGGLDAKVARLPITNRTVQTLFDNLFERFNFTIAEDSPLDQEVAIDPEMLGKIFESIVLEREHDPGVDLRKATGSYYTPRAIVTFMCRAALSEYLSDQSGVERERVSKLLDLPPASQMTDAERGILQNLLTTAESQALKALLLQLRACDPAVGSGAFLVGLLQAMSWTVQSLDWLLEGDSALEQRNYSYDLKKQIIENCLYGVDIQDQAIQICRLRLWLSLVVDYELPTEEPIAQAIRQVPALPNLAYKVLQGDSLLERLFGKVVRLDTTHDRETQDLVEDLQMEKATYFTLDNIEEKRRREIRILKLQTRLAERLVEARRRKLVGYQRNLIGEETASDRRQRESWEEKDHELGLLEERIDGARNRLDTWLRHDDHRRLSIGNLRRQLLGDPEHPTFIWCVDFAEVYHEKGGFDVMIANPPYVRQEKITHLKEALKEVFTDTYDGYADIYIYFYAQGFHQLRSNGVLVFISSNKFMRAGYGKNLRRLLGQRITLRMVIDFGDLPIFEATTYPAVLVARNKIPDEQHAFKAFTVDELSLVDQLSEMINNGSWLQRQDELGKQGWTLIRPEVMNLMRELKERGTPLEKYVDGKFYRGIVTGLNRAFVIDRQTRDRLMSEDPRSAEIIRRWVRGRDVKRWKVEWGGEYLIFTRRGVDISRFPAIARYLSQFREQLEPGGLRGRKPGNYKWYEIQDTIAYYSEFDEDKIIYPHFNTRPNFAYDQKGVLGNDKTYLIPGGSLYLLGILNSNVTDFYLHQICPSVQQGYLEFRTPYIGQIPIPVAQKDQSDTIERLVRKLLAAEGEGPLVDDLERKLNAITYEIYGLSQAEVGLLSNQSHKT